MSPLLFHSPEYERGVVSQSGYASIDGAETYGSAASIGACSLSLGKLWKAFRQGERLSLYSKSEPVLHPKTEDDLAEWCSAHFPVCYAEYLRREAEEPSHR